MSQTTRDLTPELGSLDLDAATLDALAASWEPVGAIPFPGEAQATAIATGACSAWEPLDPIGEATA